MSADTENNRWPKVRSQAAQSAAATLLPAGMERTHRPEKPKSHSALPANGHGKPVPSCGSLRRYDEPHGPEIGLIEAAGTAEEEIHAHHRQADR